jgi:hypothetical protein
VYGKAQARDICRNAIAGARRFSSKARAPMVVNGEAQAAGSKPAATQRSSKAQQLTAYASKR